jgi:hypothetical protein
MRVVAVSTAFAGLVCVSLAVVRLYVPVHLQLSIHVYDGSGSAAIMHRVIGSSRCCARMLPVLCRECNMARRDTRMAGNSDFARESVHDSI